MISRKEINQRYYENHKDELKNKRKVKLLKKKKQDMKKQLSEIDFVEKNIYLEKMGGYEMDEYCEKRKRKFYLQYDIDCLDKREKGDVKRYSKEKKDAYKTYCLEMDVKHRIEKFRLFRNSYLEKFGKEPNLTSMVVNEIQKPEEIDINSEKYDEKLLCYLERKDGDKDVKIKQVSDEISDEE